MSTSLANPRRTKLDAWPSRHHAAGERDQAAAPSTSSEQEHAQEKRDAAK